MNKKDRTDKIFQEYLYLINDIKEYMHLHHWIITLKWKDDLEYDARLSSCAYKYFNAEISFDNRTMLFNEKIEVTSEQVCQLFIHEVCHIFTWAWSQYILEEWNWKFLDYNLWEKYTTTMYNSVLSQEEMNTNLIDKVIMKAFKETNWYKKFDKEFSKLIK